MTTDLVDGTEILEKRLLKISSIIVSIEANLLITYLIIVLFAGILLDCVQIHANDNSKYPQVKIRSLSIFCEALGIFSIVDGLILRSTLVYADRKEVTLHRPIDITTIHQFT